MKALLLSTLAAFTLPLAALAQSPTAVANGNLETWKLRNAIDAPVSWATIDDFLVEAGLPAIAVPRTVTKTTNAHGGSFAAQLQGQALDLRGMAVVPARPAIRWPYRSLNWRKDEPFILPAVLLKTSVNEDGDLVEGIPYTSRPARLQFWYKLTGATAAADSAVAAVFLTNKFSAVGSAAEVLAPQATYTLMDMPVAYSSNAQPDTLRLQFSSSVAIGGGPNTVLLIDDVQLVGTVTGTRSSVAAAGLQVYPNPSATGEFSLASLTDAALSTAPFTVTDATGRVVLRKAAAPVSEARGRFVDLRSQRAGVYLLRLEAPAGPVVRKLVIQ